MSLKFLSEEKNFVQEIRILKTCMYMIWFTNNLKSMMCDYINVITVLLTA